MNNPFKRRITKKTLAAELDQLYSNLNQLSEAAYHQANLIEELRDERDLWRQQDFIAIASKYDDQLQAAQNRAANATAALAEYLVRASSGKECLPEPVDINGTTVEAVRGRDGVYIKKGDFWFEYDDRALATGLVFDEVPR